MKLAQTLRNMALAAAMAVAALVAVPAPAHAANDAWTTIYANEGTRTYIYGISTTDNLFTPALVLPKMGSEVQAIVQTASSTAVVTSRGVFSQSLNDGKPVVASDPSGTIGSAINGSTAGALAEVTDDSKVKAVGFTVTPSTTGVLTSVYVQVIAPR